MSIGTPVVIINANTASNAPQSLTTTASVPSGAAIFVIITQNADLHATANLIQDAVGNTYNLISYNWNSGQGLYVGVYATYNATALPSGDAITQHTSGFAGYICLAFYVTGLVTSAALDVDAGWSNGPFGASISKASGTLSQASELVLYIAGNVGTSPSYGGGGTAIGDQQDAPYSIGASYDIVASTASVTPTMAWTGNTTSSHDVLTFKGASSGLTLALTGAASNSAQGNLALNTNLPLGGISITSVQGTIVYSPNFAVAGIASNSSSGSVALTNTLALIGKAFTSTPGTIAPNFSIPLTGQVITSATGNVTYSAGGNVTIGITGQTSTSSAGNLTASAVFGLSGQVTTSAVGSVAPGLAVAPLGKSATLTSGSLATALSISASGRTVASSAGSLSPGTGPALGGQSVVSGLGNVGLAFSITLLGKQLLSLLGNIFVPSQGFIAALSRTLGIGLQNRTYEVVAQNRTYLVPTQNRVYQVPDSNRETNV